MLQGKKDFENVEDTSNVNNEIVSKDFPQLKVTYRERAKHLKKFELNILDDDEYLIAEFEELMKRGKIKSDEPLYNAWIALKIASIPTEEEALLETLRSNIAGKIPRPKSTVNRLYPEGASRYNLTSEEWMAKMKETAARRGKKQPGCPTVERKTVKIYITNKK